MAETTTAIQTIDTEQVSVVISSAPQILTTNRTSVERASGAGQALLDTIQGAGMSDELDQKVNSYLVKIRKTIEEMNDRRKPITQIMDLIKKEFTTLEAQLDPKNAASLYARLQRQRDAYAESKIRLQRQQEEEARRKLEIDKELIRLKQECSMQLETYFSTFLSSRVGKITEMYNGMSLMNWDPIKVTIENFIVDYPYEHFESFTPNLRRVYASKDQTTNVIIDATKGKFADFGTAFRKRLIEAKQSILDRLPSRRAELEEIAAVEKRSTEKAAEMRRQAEERAAADQRRIAAEEDERRQQSETKITTTAQASMTEALFDAQQTIVAAPQTASPVRESYTIEVLNPLGYALIASFYFEHEGKTEDLAKLERKTLGSMKKFAESYAIKHDVKISSPFLKYQETFKTIAKK